MRKKQTIKKSVIYLWLCKKLFQQMYEQKNVLYAISTLSTKPRFTRMVNCIQFLLCIYFIKCKLCNNSKAICSPFSFHSLLVDSFKHKKVSPCLDSWETGFLFLAENEWFEYYECAILKTTQEKIIQFNSTKWAFSMQWQEF